MLTAQVNEIIRLYPLGALAIPKCIHLQKLTDSKSKYKKVLRTPKNILRRNASNQKQRLLLLFYNKNPVKHPPMHEPLLVQYVVRVATKKNHP